MRIQNLLPLFLILTLLTSISLIPYAHASTVFYQGFNWISDGCVSAVPQSQIQGSYPNARFNNIFQPQASATECLILNKNMDCFTDTTDPCWYEGSFTIDYLAFSYSITTSASANHNTTIIREQGTTGNGLSFNTSVTHVANNQFLLTWKRATAMSEFNYGNEVLGQFTGCEDYFLLNANEEYDFIFQMRNESSIDVWLGNATYPMQRWCNYTSTTQFNAYRLANMRLGYSSDDGPGAATGSIFNSIRGIVQGFGCLGTPVHTIASSMDLFDCDAPIRAPPVEEQEGEGPPIPIDAPPPAFGEGNQSSFITLFIQDQNNNFRSQFAQGETMILDGRLRFINDTAGGALQDAPTNEIVNFFRFDEFFDDWTFIGSEPTIDLGAGLGPRARLPYVHIDGLVLTTDFRANYTGNLVLNISSTISNIQRIITVEDAQIPLSVGTRLSPPLIEGTRTGTIQEPLEASNIIPQNIFAHLEPFRVSTFLTRIDTGATLSSQMIFLQMDINATGNWVHFQTLTTNTVGRVTSEFRIWDTRFIGEQRFRFVYFSSPPFANSTSVNGTAFVSSIASDFRLTIEIIPPSILEGQRAEIRGQLTNIGNDQFGTPIPNERINIFISSFDKTAFFNLEIASSTQLDIRTDANGFYAHVIFGPNTGGASSQSMDIFANSSINSVVVTSANATLTITEQAVAPPQEIGDVQPPNFLVFSALIDNPKANCQFSDGKICSTMLWMLIVFIVSSVLALMSVGLKIPSNVVGIGWLFMMLGGMIMGVAVQAVLEILLFIGALPVIVVLFISISAILRGGSRGIETA